MLISGRRVFWMLSTAGAFLVAVTIGDLPATVATNFGGGGVPHAWMDRWTYAGYLTVMGLVVPLVTVAITARRNPSQSGHWWLGSLLVGFVLGLHLVILGAHRTQPPRLSTGGFLTVLGFFATGLALWIVGWRRSGHPED